MVEYTGGRVFSASNGMLYLVGGSNCVSDLYQETGFERAVDSSAWRRRFVERHRLAETLKSTFLQLIVPEKLSVYPLGIDDKNRIFTDVVGASIEPPGRRLLKIAAHSQVIYPDIFLRQQTQQYKIFPNTDSHWTWTGAFSAFQVLMTKLEVTPDYPAFVRLPKRKISYFGDLSGSEFPDREIERFERIVLPEHVRRVYCNALIGLKESEQLDDEAGLHGGSHCIFVNEASQFDQTVIIFGSSFSECRLEPSLLTAIFAYYFKTVHFVWSTSMDIAYIARHRPAIIIAEMPERFLTECPEDDLELESFAAKKLREWSAKDQNRREY